MGYTKDDGTLWNNEEWKLILENCSENLKIKINCYRKYTFDKLEREKEILDNRLNILYQQASTGLCPLIEHNSLSNMFSISIGLLSYYSSRRYVLFDCSNLILTCIFKLIAIYTANDLFKVWKAIIDNQVIKNGRRWTIRGNIPWMGDVKVLFNRKFYDHIIHQVNGKDVHSFMVLQE